jgi:hypothetical protein
MLSIAVWTMPDGACKVWQTSYPHSHPQQMGVTVDERENNSLICEEKS